MGLGREHYTGVVYVCTCVCQCLCVPVAKAKHSSGKQQHIKSEILFMTPNDGHRILL